MQPLIDGDILVYEIGYASEVGWSAIQKEKGGEDSPPPFDYVADLLEKRINEICFAAKATEPPIIFLSSGNNFRNDLAVTKGYKANRDKSKKPYHYKNIIAHLIVSYGAITVDGIEADDAMAIEQCKRSQETIICSRDKDLRMVPGWHYSWELGKQPSFGPALVDELGYLEQRGNKIFGVGRAFFYYQLLVGDTVDNIPGCPGVGPVNAFKYLKHKRDKKEYFETVYNIYCGAVPNPDEYITEQGQLLWIVREVDEDGNPILWSLYEEM